MCILLFKSGKEVEISNEVATKIWEILKNGTKRPFQTIHDAEGIVIISLQLSEVACIYKKTY